MAADIGRVTDDDAGQGREIFGRSDPAATALFEQRVQFQRTDGVDLAVIVDGAVDSRQERSPDGSWLPCRAALSEHCLEQGVCPGHAGLAQQDGFGPVYRIGDVALAMQALQGVPVEGFPGAVMAVERQAEERQDGIIDLFGIYLHMRPSH